MRRSPEARTAADRGIALSPTFRDLHTRKIVSYLAEGDLAGARGVLASLPPPVPYDRFAASFLGGYLFPWVFPEAERERLDRLPPEEFSGGSERAAALANLAWFRGDVSRAREFAQVARASAVEQLRASPSSAVWRYRLGAMLAILGRAVESVREFERALELAPKGINEWDRANALYQFAVAEVRLGHAEAAIDRLEELLAAPWYVTRAWLAIDSNFDPLRGNPRFERLIAEKP